MSFIYFFFACFLWFLVFGAVHDAISLLLLLPPVALFFGPQFSSGFVGNLVSPAICALLNAPCTLVHFACTIGSFFKIDAPGDLLFLKSSCAGCSFSHHFMMSHKTLDGAFVFTASWLQWTPLTLYPALIIADRNKANVGGVIFKVPAIECKQ